MNEVFLAKLRSQEKFDNNGRVFSLASTQHVPAMGNNVNPPKNVTLSDSETTTASVSPPPAPTRVASADAGSSGAMFGSVFRGGGVTKGFKGGDEDKHPAPQAAPAAATKPRPASQTRTAAAHPSAGAIRPAQSHAQVAEERKPAPPATAQQPAPAVTASALPVPAPAQAQTPGMISGAAPVVPASSFDNRWGGFR